MTLTIPNTLAALTGAQPLSKVDANFTAISTYVNNRNPTSGLLAARPAAGNAGAIYYATDNGTIYLDNGASWVVIGGIAVPALDGARGLRVTNEDVAQGTWNSGTTTYAAVATATYNLFDGSANHGHIVSAGTKFQKVHYFIYTAAAPGTVTVEYWNGAWTTVVPTTSPSWNTVGWSELRFAIPADWVVGGSGTNVPAGSYNLRVTNTGAAFVTVVGRCYSGSRVTITADEVVASDTSGNKYRTTSASLTPDILTAGSAANGRDQAGTFGANSWAYAFAIYNAGSATWAGLWSASATAPTMPTGYTAFARLHAGRVDANGNLLMVEQVGAKARFFPGIKDNPGIVIVNVGIAANPNAITCTVPTIATAVDVAFNNTAFTNAYYINQRPFSTIQLNANVVPDVFCLAYASGNAVATAQDIPIMTNPGGVTFYVCCNGGTTADISTLGFKIAGNLS